MSRFNNSTNHPIISNTNEVMYDRKFISIHSEDRDQLKYPNPSNFEIELPQDYMNVLAVQLNSWSFPKHYNVFSELNQNITMTFQINNPYKPIILDTLQEAIYNALNTNKNNDFTVTIEEGYYTPIQIQNELTNKFNNAVHQYLLTYLTSIRPSLISNYNKNPYNKFIIVYNEVNNKLWFGNTNSGFILTNEQQYKLKENFQCSYINAHQLPSYSDWGLPSYLGLSKTNMASKSTNDIETVRFYYQTHNSGYWLTPDVTSPGCSIHYVKSPNNINLIGQTHYYMELSGLNSLDETNPFYVNAYNLNMSVNKSISNGTTNSAFAKIPISTSTDNISNGNTIINIPQVSKIFNPPAERIKKINVKIRYHNGSLVDFGELPYSFVLEFAILTPQKSLNYNIYTPEFIKYS